MGMYSSCLCTRRHLEKARAPHVLNLRNTLFFLKHPQRLTAKLCGAKYTVYTTGPMRYKSVKLPPELHSIAPAGLILAWILLFKDFTVTATEKVFLEFVFCYFNKILRNTLDSSKRFSLHWSSPRNKWNLTKLGSLIFLLDTTRSCSGSRAPPNNN